MCLILARELCHELRLLLVTVAFQCQVVHISYDKRSVHVVGAGQKLEDSTSVGLEVASRVTDVLAEGEACGWPGQEVLVDSVRLT